MFAEYVLSANSLQMYITAPTADREILNMNFGHYNNWTSKN